MSTTLPPPPVRDPIVELTRGPGVVLGAPTLRFATYLRDRDARTQASAFAVTTVAKTAQTAAIATTDLVPVASGLYRVSYRVRVTTPAGVSSSVQVIVTTTEGGVPCTQSSAAYTGNATNAPQSGAFLVDADASSPIAYSVAYASNPAAAMGFELDVIVEKI